MIPVVLDTNILVSAGITPGGPCDLIVQAALRGSITLVVSPGIREEYLDVLNRSKFTRHGFPPPWVNRLLEKAMPLPTDPREGPPGPDPDDRLFLAVAQTAGILVTGNLKHFPEANHGVARVLGPGEFIRLHPGITRTEPGPLQGGPARSDADPLQPGRQG